MGLRSSKNSPNSYDIAPVVANNDFSYSRSPRPLPEVVLPPVKEAKEEGSENDSKLTTNDEKTTLTTATPILNNESNKVNGDVVAENINIVKEDIQKSEVNAANNEVKTPDDTIDSRIPDWVNEENFKPLLLKSYPTFKEIVTFKPYPALAAGENYATLMLRVKITIKLEDDTTKDLSYMLKVAHDNKEMMDMLQHMNFFNTENAVYNEVIPEIEEMYRQAGVSVEVGPKAHRLAAEAPSAYYVLLDDLSLRGFRNANRLECLDMEHTLAVLKKLAQFHAATACRVATKGEYAEIFSPNMDNDMVRGMMSQMFGSFKKPFMAALPTYENGEKYVEKMVSGENCQFD